MIISAYAGISVTVNYWHGFRGVTECTTVTHPVIAWRFNEDGTCDAITPFGDIDEITNDISDFAHGEAQGQTVELVQIRVAYSFPHDGGMEYEI